MGMNNNQAVIICDRQILPFLGRHVKPTPLSIAFGIIPEGSLFICCQLQLFTQGDGVSCCVSYCKAHLATESSFRTGHWKMDVEERKLGSADRQADIEKAASPRPGALGLRSRPQSVCPRAVLWLSHVRLPPHPSQMRPRRCLQVSVWNSSFVQFSSPSLN